MSGLACIKTTCKKQTFGVEVEVEGHNIGSVYCSFWDKVVDHSLRGESCEFVLKEASSLSYASRAIQALKEQLVNGTVLPSIRTSVHIHLNVQHMTYLQIMNIITVYFALENVFMSWCGAKREGNPFCLRNQDSEDQLLTLISSAKSRNFNRLKNGFNRYASLNLQAIFSKGSLEFRGMPLPTDLDDILIGMDVVRRIKKFARKFKNPREVAKQLAKGHVQFAKDAFGVHYDTFDNGQVEQNMATCSVFVNDLAYCMVW